MAKGESAVPEQAEMEDTLSAELLVEESSVVSEFENLEEPSRNELVDSEEAEVDTKMEDIAASKAPIDISSKRSSDIRLPSVLMMQESLQNLEAQRQTRFYSYN